MSIYLIPRLISYFIHICLHGSLLIKIVSVPNSSLMTKRDRIMNILDTYLDYSYFYTSYYVY